MACFDDYINVRATCSATTTPSTGLYIDDLPGLTISKAAHVTEDFAKGTDLLDQCVTQGIIRVRNKLVSKLMGTVLFNQTLSTGTYGKFRDYLDDSTKYLAATAASRGLRFELDECCRLTEIQVKRVRILLNTTVTNETLTITDGVENNTYTFSATAMVPVYVETNFKANSDLVFITLDNTSISVNDSSLNYTGSCGFCDNDCIGHESCSCNSGLNAWGWDGTNKTGHTYGLSAVVHTVCSQDRFFCEINQFEPVAQAVWYQSGAIFLDHLLRTSRVNVYTNYRREEAQEWKEEWEALAMEHIDLIADKLPKYLMNVCPDCLECNSSRWVYSSA